MKIEDIWCFQTRARQRQDNDKTNVEPVHSYDAFHTSRCRTWCERHHRNAQVQHLSCRCLVVVLSLSCRCLVVVLLWFENTNTHVVIYLGPVTVSMKTVCHLGRFEFCPFQVYRSPEYGKKPVFQVNTSEVKSDLVFIVLSVYNVS